MFVYLINPKPLEPTGYSLSLSQQVKHPLLWYQGGSLSLRGRQGAVCATESRM